MTVRIRWTNWLQVSRAYMKHFLTCDRFLASKNFIHSGEPDVELSTDVDVMFPVETFFRCCRQPLKRSTFANPTELSREHQSFLSAHRPTSCRSDVHGLFLTSVITKELLRRGDYVRCLCMYRFCLACQVSFSTHVSMQSLTIANERNEFAHNF